MAIDYKEYANQMRVNAVKDENGNIICSPELWEQIASLIEIIATADVVEVKHGEWIKLDGEWREQGTNKPLIIHQCSFCCTFYQNAPYNYCPNCGAKMDGRSDT